MSLSADARHVARRNLWLAILDVQNPNAPEESPPPGGYRAQSPNETRSVEITSAPTIVVGGEPTTAQTVLDAPAAAGGAPVQVTSSDPATIPAPDSIVVPAGSTSKSAALPTLPVAASTPVIVSATRNGVTRSATVTVQPPPVTIASLVIAPASLIGTNPATGTVTLSGAAPAGGVEVELLSSQPTIATVPSALSIPAGATSGTFVITTSRVSAAQPVNITAAHATTEKVSTLTVLPPSGNYVSSISLAPSFIVGGTSALGTVTLAMPSDHTSDVALTSSNAALLSVPAKATVRNNDLAAIFPVATSSVTAPTAVTVTASFGGVVQQAKVIVSPANAVTLASFTITPARVSGGNSATGIVTLTGPAPAGGAAVAITSRRRNMVIVPATVMVQEGTTNAAFVIATDVVHGKKEKSTEIDASYNGVTATATIAIAPRASASTTASRHLAQCASLALVPCLMRSALDTVSETSTSFEKSYSLYSPELNLFAETVASQTTNPSIAYEYVWFAGQPLAQIETSTGAVHWYFTDHLGTPILQTDINAREMWRPEYEPYGIVFAFRRGEAKHQPLRFPGQENDPSSEVTYNVFRWYRSGWGRYTQADRYISVNAWEPNPFAYARENPVGRTDPLGLFSIDRSCDCTGRNWNVPRIIDKACRYRLAPKCQDVLGKHNFVPLDRAGRGRTENLRKCLDRRCGPDSVGTGPTIYCSPARDNCGYTNPSGTGIWLYDGPDDCPRWSFNQARGTKEGFRDYSQTLFHEMIHTCGLGVPMQGGEFPAMLTVTEVCTGAAR